jgi:hypothetical protein
LKVTGTPPECIRRPIERDTAASIDDQKITAAGRFFKKYFNPLRHLIKGSSVDGNAKRKRTWMQNHQGQNHDRQMPGE